MTKPRLQRWKLPRCGASEAPAEKPEAGQTAEPVPASASSNFNGLSPEIRAEDLKYEDSWLADPAREGRETGTPGAEASAEFLTNPFPNDRLEAPSGMVFSGTF